MGLLLGVLVAIIGLERGAGSPHRPGERTQELSLVSMDEWAAVHATPGLPALHSLLRIVLHMQRLVTMVSPFAEYLRILFRYAYVLAAVRASETGCSHGIECFTVRVGLLIIQEKGEVGKRTLHESAR